jgi:amino acid adenylation domain-containing protein
MEAGVPTRLEQLVIDSARRDPDRVAVRDRDGEWTYRELDRWSDRLAAHFQRLGVGPGDRVAVWAPKSRLAVAVLQAALRLNAAYVPIDPATPGPRARTMLDDCDVRLIVAPRARQASLDSDRAWFALDDEGALEALADAPDQQPDQRPYQRIVGTADDLAYVLYTSGSTGTPKGVCISHRNALAFVEWAVQAVGAGRGEVFSNHASFNFDLSVFDLYGAFLGGGTVCLIPETIAYAASSLASFIETQRISIWYSVPSVLVLMMQHGGLFAGGGHVPSVVVFAGEPFAARHLRELRAHWPHARLFNFYGPTETNVCTSYEVVDLPAEQIKPVPIGSAASGDRVWAETEDGRVAEVGERGELIVDGPTVMLGYWGAPPHRGPYRTGDICVRLPDDGYDFVGRRDHMIKHRGHRIEPGEIEATLSQHPRIKEIAVVAAGEGVDQRLVAYLVAQADGAPSLLDLKAFGARRLPPYMLVDDVRTLSELPRTPNGKVDRRALVSLRSAEAARAVGAVPSAIPKECRP